MGCAAAIPLRITIRPNLQRTRVSTLDSLYALVQRLIDRVNKINSGLCVTIDKFQTVAGLHQPPRSLACGVMAMLACISAVVQGEMLRIDFHLMQEIPGFGLNDNLLPPQLGNVYQLWINFVREVEAALQDFQELMPDFIQAVKKFKTLPNDLGEFVTDSSTNAIQLKRISTINKQRLEQSQKFFGEVLKKTTGYMKEIAWIQKSLNDVQVVAEFIRLGQRANKLCIFWPEDLMQAFGKNIERFINDRTQ